MTYRFGIPFEIYKPPPLSTSEMITWSEGRGRTCNTWFIKSQGVARKRLVFCHPQKSRCKYVYANPSTVTCHHPVDCRWNTDFILFTTSSWNMHFQSQPVIQISYMLIFCLNLRVFDSHICSSSSSKEQILLDVFLFLCRDSLKNVSNKNNGYGQVRYVKKTRWKINTYLLSSSRKINCSIITNVSLSVMDSQGMR